MLMQLAASAIALLLAFPASGASSPLPGWRDGAARQRLVTFITNAGAAGHVDYVPPQDRVAVLDDDGTLWPEKPRPQGVFALERLRSIAPGHPEWKSQLPFAAALDLGTKFLQEAGTRDVLELLATAHAGRTQDAFRNDVRTFFATACIPSLPTSRWSSWSRTSAGAASGSSSARPAASSWCANWPGRSTASPRTMSSAAAW